MVCSLTTRDFAGPCPSGSTCLTLREVVWLLFHVAYFDFCTLVRIPLVTLPWSDPVAFPVASVVVSCGFCVCCVFCVFGRLVVGRACPCPLFVGWFASLCGLVACLFWCSPVAALPSSPLPLGVWWSVVPRSPSFVSVWISGCFGNGLGVWPVCTTSCLLLAGLEMEFAFFPSSTCCMATKASALCGARPSTPCWALVVLGFPL